MAGVSKADSFTGQKRAYALDALRGLAILMMVLSSVEPHAIKMCLPSFMYHTQVPPPFFKFDPNIPGVSWVDMVFPFFLFSMGTAIPFAIGRRIEKGVPMLKLVGSTLLRGLILSLFALYVEHIRTESMIGSSLKIFLIGTIGFLLLFPILCRLPSNWKPSTHFIVKGFGWLAAIALMFVVRYDPNSSASHSSTFSLAKFDSIIMILANVVVYTTLIYLFTRKNHLLRLGFLGLIIAMRLSFPENGGWVQTLVNNFPIPIVNAINAPNSIAISILKTFNTFFSLTIVFYLFITIPATIIGDRIVKWMNSEDQKAVEKSGWSKLRSVGLASLLFITVVTTLVLLKGRYIWQLVICLIPLLLIGNSLVRKPVSSIETLIHDIYKWGMYMLAVGITFEPYEGGIRKDFPTMSYYFVAGGLAIFMLLVFTVIIDIVKSKRAVQLLIDNGQNPMIAYTAGGNLIGTTFVLCGIDALAKRSLVTPWSYFCYSVIFTLLVALVVSFFTRKKIFWRT